jgi:hypothetical protein
MPRVRASLVRWCTPREETTATGGSTITTTLKVYFFGPSIDRSSDTFAVGPITSLRRLNAITLHENYSCVTSIPASRKRLQMRGYDHAALFARSIATLSGLTYRPLLVQAYEFHQTGLGRNARLSTPKYIVSERLKGHKILLIDDVSTTRTSLSKAVCALKIAGASECRCAHAGLSRAVDQARKRTRRTSPIPARRCKTYSKAHVKNDRSECMIIDAHDNATAPHSSPQWTDTDVVMNVAEQLVHDLFEEADNDAMYHHCAAEVRWLLAHGQCSCSSEEIAERILAWSGALR